MIKIYPHPQIWSKSINLGNFSLHEGVEGKKFAVLGILLSVGC